MAAARALPHACIRCHSDAWQPGLSPLALQVVIKRSSPALVGLFPRCLSIRWTYQIPLQSQIPPCLCQLEMEVSPPMLSFKHNVIFLLQMFFRRYSCQKMQVWEQDFRPCGQTFRPQTVVPPCRGMTAQQCKLGYSGGRGGSEKGQNRPCL